MTCPACGTDVPVSAGQCPSCSASVAGSAPGPVASPGLGGAAPHQFGPDEEPAQTVVSPSWPAQTPFDDRTVLSGSATPMAADGFDAPTIASVGPADTAVTPAVNDGVGEDTGPLRAGQAFGPRYHIMRVLGVGGMGAVYQAWDAELGEAVAIKVIRPEVMANPTAAWELEKRFKRELLLARQVTHKNVVRIHDLGEINGIKYITMTYVEGTDLATVLKQEGALEVPRVLAIMRSVAAGLLAAHTAGVVHRDLKPGNIMVPAVGEALIMDFGIARSMSGPAASSGTVMSELPADLRHSATNYTEATMAGSIVGTVQYMAPEQARGEEVDQRADLYALGLIVYDMLTGRQRMKRAENPRAELQLRMQVAPPPVQVLAPGVPDALSKLIARCLEPDREVRIATTAELVAELERLDDRGVPRPVRRVVGLPLVALAATLLLALAGGAIWYVGQAPPPPHDPVSVIIADFQNSTNDPVFDHTLEPMLKRALEDASFITAYERNGIRGLGVPRRDRLDEAAAHELAVQQGLGVVLAGSIAPQGDGYRLSLRATETVSGAEIASEEARAAGKDQVLDVATRLVARVRSALGDDTSESAQQFAMASISATSLDVVRLYAKAMEAQSGNRFDEALQAASQAVGLDPNFGIGYLILAVASRNLGRLSDNQAYLGEALSHLDGMTERERYQTRGYSYWSTGDYQQCVKEYSDLIARYPGDVGGRNQVALCLSNLREMRRAMDEVQEIVKILPSHPLFRDNLALYANYASDFQTAEDEARKVEGPDAYAALALAFAQLGQDQLSEARTTYQRIATLGPQGESMAASGLGDLAAVEGRFSDAVQILRQGAAADLTAQNADAAAAKLAAVAFVELSHGRSRQAIEAAEEALAQSTGVKIKFLAARTFVEAGDAARARPLMDGLAQELYAEPRAYAQIIDGLITLKDGDARQAMATLRAANDLFNTWIGSFDLGRASLAAGAFTQADSAFDVCLNARRGEALALFVDEEPTYAYLPQVYYYQGLVREALKSVGAAESFRRYLALRDGSTEDPLVPQARERVGR